MQCFLLSALGQLLLNSPTDHVKAVPTLARDCYTLSVLELRLSINIELTQTTIISWVFACWTCAVEMDLADTTDIVVGDVPSPCRYRVPSLDFDLHVSCIGLPNCDPTAQRSAIWYAIVEENCRVVCAVR